MVRIRKFLTLAAFLPLVGVAPAWGEESTLTQDAKKAAEKTEAAINDAIDKNSLVVDFEKGSAKLTERQSMALRALIEGLDENSQKQRIYVVSYPDDEVADKQESLDKNSVRLAEQRLDAVTSALKKLSVKGKITRINMARHPDALKKLPGGEKLDDANKRAPANTTNHENNTSVGKRTGEDNPDEIASILERRGGPSNVVVLIE